MKDCCKKFNSFFDGKRVEDINGLKDILKEVKTDFNTWTTYYECKVCGSSWIERYEIKGHGEVPIVKKVQ